MMKTLLLILCMCTPLTAQDGSVLFWQNGYLVKPIENHTGSDITHAAVILNGYVYEAVPPCVHKVPIAEYFKQMAEKQHTPAMERRGFAWFVLQPATPYTEAEVAAMTQYAESQLGRPYMIRGWNRHEAKGVFCSEYAADILEKSGRIKSAGFRESPGSLYDKVKPFSAN